MNKCSGLQAVSEDDTIFLDFDRISSDMYCRPGVGSSGTVFCFIIHRHYHPQSRNQKCIENHLIEIDGILLLSWFY